MPAVRAWLSERRAALGAGACVWLAGFGALNIIFMAGLGEPHLPGLYDFLAATVGDGLLLPIWAYALIRALTPATFSPTDKRYIWISALLGGLVGACVQAAWLIDPEPRLNWTLPAAHTFNFAGWYHAAFLVTALAFFSAACTGLYIHIRTKAGASGSGRPGFADANFMLVTAPGLAFLGILAFDNGAPDHVGGILLLLFFAALVLPAVLLSVGFGVKSSVLVAISSLLPALGFVALFSPGITMGFPLLLGAVCAGLLGAVAAGSLSIKRGIPRLTVCASLGLTAAGPALALADWADGQLAQIALAFLVSLGAAGLQAIVLREILQPAIESVGELLFNLVGVAPILGLAAAGEYFGQDPSQAESKSAATGVVAAALALTVGGSLARRRFAPVILAENSSASNEQISEEKWRAYGALIPLVGAVLASLVLFAIGTIESWRSTTLAPFSELILMGAVLVGCAAPLVISTRAAPVNASRPREILGIVCLALWGMAAIIASLDHAYTLIQWAFGIGLGSIAALFVAEGIVSNAGYLHNQPIRRSTAATSVACAFATGSTVFWLIGPSLERHGVPSRVDYAVASLVIGGIAFVSLPYLAAAGLPEAHPQEQFARATPLGGILQDCFLMFLLATFVGWLPTLVLVHLDEWVSWVGLTAAYLAFLARAYVFVMHNNVGHVHRETKRLTEEAASQHLSLTPEQVTALAGLRTHIHRQNLLAFAALFPVLWIPLSAEINGFDDGGIMSILRA